jgi:hypothetical protein
MNLWTIILTDLKAIIAKIESEAQNAWSFFTAYVQEAISEEEAALFPQIEAQASQLLQDEAKTAGLTVKERVAMAVTELTADLSADAALAAQTLYNAYVWTVAHKLGLQDGNQGTSTTGDFSGNTTPTT